MKRLIEAFALSFVFFCAVQAADNAVAVPSISAVADTAIVPKNSQAFIINVLANDIGTGLRVTAVTQGAHGAVQIINSSNGGIALTGVTYTPAQNYVGGDQFTYTITDSTNATSTGTVAVNVVDNNVTKPVANPDTATVLKNSPGVDINVLANDTGTGIHITAFTQPQHGTTTMSSSPTAGANIPTSINYKPATDYMGQDGFTYTITDANGVTAVGQVGIFIPVLDPLPPIANADTARLPKNSPGVAIFVLANDVGAGLVIVGNTPPLHGTATILAATGTAPAAISYVPAKDYAGQDGFAYTIKDANGASATGQVSIVVEDTVPPPACKANPDNATVPKNSSGFAINVLANDTGSGIHVTAVTQPAHGSAQISTSTSGNIAVTYVTYKPATDYVGPDTFSYTITDSSNATSTADVAVTVFDPNPPPPIHANPDQISIPKNSPRRCHQCPRQRSGTGLKSHRCHPGRSRHRDTLRPHSKPRRRPRHCLLQARHRLRGLGQIQLHDHRHHRRHVER